eukprot:TRINITY_DN39146_c0_g1_i1.p1 TRINITY_DN39146_c0_g1~~TRINITY_DN39146_c0_g1_i1.p1  ORF type:complete len:165 (-),score=21.95 TRINITY_DN39146_c0_g1_i1:123-617(-)
MHGVEPCVAAGNALETGCGGCAWLAKAWETTQALQCLQQYGLFCVEEPILSCPLVLELRAAAEERVADVMTAASAFRAASGQEALDCIEAVERDGGRWDIRYRMDEPPFAALLADPPWQAAIRDVLGDDHRRLFAGIVLASGAQPASCRSSLRASSIPSPRSAG